MSFPEIGLCHGWIHQQYGLAHAPEIEISKKLSFPKTESTGKLVHISSSWPDISQKPNEDIYEIRMDEFSSNTVWLITWKTEISEKILDEFSRIFQ